jgi:hypothetical protein
MRYVPGYSWGCRSHIVLPAKVFWDSKLLEDVSITATVALHTRKEQPHSDEGRSQEGVSGGDLDGPVRHRSVG